jgi:alkylmercury lyase
MSAGAVDTAEIAEQLACCLVELDASDQRAQLALFRLLAEGEPVDPDRLAARADLQTADVLARLRRWPEVPTDPEGRVVAFNGLSTVETPHRLRIEGRTVYAWCAWDTLFLPELIGHSAEVESTCPGTGAAVSLRVGPEGPSDVRPSRAILSFLLPASAFGDDSSASFCGFIHFFAFPGAAEGWTRRRPGTFVISIDEGFEIGRRTNTVRWGEALRAPRV